MAFLQENLSRTHTLPSACNAMMAHVLRRFCGAMPDRQTRAHLDDDLHRLAETSPHLLDDIGVAFEQPPAAVSLPVCGRGC